MSHYKDPIPESPSFETYLRTGNLPPLLPNATKQQVEALLGKPPSWIDKEINFFFGGPCVEDPYDAPVWHYGCLSICFPDSSRLGRRLKISLNYHPLEKEVTFPHAFGLPAKFITLGNLTRFLRSHGIDYIEDLHAGGTGSGPILITEGNIGVCTHKLMIANHAQVSFFSSMPWGETRQTI
jgi:hypothetical protein